MLPLAAGETALIEPIPGLMIWTLVCFCITFFVLRKFAFGPIQQIIDERRERIARGASRGRQRPRRGAQAARGAQEPDAAGARPGRGDPRRGAPRRRVAARARAQGDRGGPAAAARGDQAPDRGGDAARARRDPARRSPTSRSSPPSGSRAARSTAKAHRTLIDDAIEELDFSKLEKERGLVGRRAPHLRPRALRRREGPRTASRRCPRGARRLRRPRRERCPSCGALLENPEIDHRTKQAACSASCSRAAKRSCATSCSC